MIENNMTHHTHPDSCFLTSNASHFYGITAFELITTLRRVLEGTTTGRRSSRTAEHIRYPFRGLSQNGEWRATVTAHGANFRAVPCRSDTDVTLQRAPRCLQASHLSRVYVSVGMLHSHGWSVQAFRAIM